jgi:choline dehydrogenase
VNAPGAKGVSPYPIASRDFRRVSTADAYLEPARSLPTLTIAGDALVDRIVVDGGRAVGIEVVRAGGRSVERADEIVLCAGSIHTPCILMRSGIGPADLLTGLGIDVVADLPVGQSLQDHPMLGLVLPLRPETSVTTLDDRSTNCCARFDSGDPDGMPYDLMLLSMNWTDPTGANWPYHPVPDIPDIRSSGTIGIWLNSTYSRGSVRITSRDPAAQPVVDENMLSDERDLRRMRHAARVLAELVESDPVASICRVDPHAANAELWESLDDDRALGHNLLDAVVDTMHGTSTCPIGAVVDADLRVHGVAGLRVADASVFPSVSRTNTNLITIMVGEALADRLS